LIELSLGTVLGRPEKISRLDSIRMLARTIYWREQKEIRDAYLREMTNYHPDNVAHLGSDLRELADRKAQEINRGYEQLMSSVSA
jgi:hypothetical protein